MKRLALVVWALLAISAPLASPGAAQAQAVGAASPLAFPLLHVTQLSAVPPGFSSTGQQAIDAAKATATLQALHRTHHPLQIATYIWNGSHWEIDFLFKTKILALVDVNRAGHVTGIWTGPLAIDYGGHGHYAGLFDSPWVVVPFFVLFLLPFFDPRRPFRVLHLDLLVLLSFGVSYWLYNHTHFESAVALWYPPLIYLLGRMLWIGLRRQRRPIGEITRFPVAVLAVGLLALVGARIGLDLASNKVIDVGYASVIGAHRIAHGLPLYFPSADNSDAYGPIMYLAYVPFEQIFPWHGGWDYLPAARAAAITFDLLTIVGIVILGMRLRAGAAGRRLGLAMGWAWAAFPFTLFGLMNNTNDGLMAMLMVCVLLVFASAPARGALLGLAAAAKFFPLALLTLAASGGSALRPTRRGLRTPLICTAAFAVVAILAIVLYLPSGGISEFYNHTIGFQLTRPDVYSVWALHPSLGWLQTVVMIAAVAIAAAVAFSPRSDRSLVQVAALSAAVVIAIQLPAKHWFYYYIVWFIPFVLVALLARQSVRAGAADDEGERAMREADPHVAVGERLPELVGAGV